MSIYDIKKARKLVAALDEEKAQFKKNEEKIMNKEETQWQSVAQWPATVSLGTTNNESRDYHSTEAAALAVINSLKREGFGGDGMIFPLKTYVLPPTPPTPAGAGTETPPKCVCGSPDTSGIVHRVDGPCYHKETGNVASPELDRLRRQAEADRALIEELKEENDEGWRRVVLAEKNTIPALKEQLAIADKDRERLYHALDNLLESLETGDAEMLPHSITAGLAAIAAMQPSPSLDHGATETPKPL